MTKTERSRDGVRETQGLVDERPHSWMVGGGPRGGGMADGEKTMQQGLSRGEFIAGQAANCFAFVERGDESICLTFTISPNNRNGTTFPFIF